MPNSSPAWIQSAIAVVTVENLAVPSSPATEVAWGAIGRYEGTTLEGDPPLPAYKLVATATVGENKIVELKDISVVSSWLAVTKWLIEIGATIFADEQIIDAPWVGSFYDLKLGAGTVITVKAKSIYGATIICLAAVTGKEIG